MAMFAAITVGTLNSAGYTMLNGGWAVAIIGIVAWEVTNLVTGAPKS